MKKKIKLYLPPTVLILLAFIICFSDIDIVSPGSGIITGVDDKLEIVSPDAGFIKKFDLRAGDKIKAGEILFSYTNLDTLYQEKSLNELIMFADTRLKELKEDQTLLSEILDLNYDNPDRKFFERVDNVDRKLSAHKFIYEFIHLKEVDTNKKHRITKLKEEKKELEERVKLLQKKEGLLRKAVSPEIDRINNDSDIKDLYAQIAQNENNILVLENEVNTAKNDFTSAVLSQINKNSELIAQLSRERLDNIGKQELLKQKLKTSSIVSPVDGVILSVEKNFDVGSYVEHSQPVMLIKKAQTNKIIDAKFLSRYRPFIHPGSEVKISVSSPGFKKNISGTIKKISADSFEDENKSITERHYKVEIEPKNDENIPPELEGIPVQTYAISKNITLFEYITSLLHDNVVFNVW
ncbi:TPA: HlyD family efflux transporter periplasmic adaptor subunit [Escherichia coli]|nr:HlyD family efflux transporter periplasmic adaptor subunit [Escherichia marmotae]MEC9660358.1 HlyD family efflux transporter periplasmic adaptor subunit [Escherichia coli]MED8847204.1 HlyD family efflux transporter periplasmic adaptor subunit [Escherichia coli]MED9369238.1 HlyD family efflux transporter periplasmic adaptor subunit [Escherichia coli]MED9634512.1 HlyD family efflux transporter periplasmic adaptor subunit [Escherichia marmotae]